MSQTMKIGMTPFTAIFRVWQRYFAVFRKNIVYAIVTTFVEPVLYLVSFGFGLGALVGPIRVGDLEIPYRAFVLAGILGQNLLFQGFFEAAYGGYIRMYYQRIFQAIAVTPVTLSEVLWGELVWVATRSTLSATAVLGIGVAIGDFKPSAFLLLPYCFIASFLFASLGMLVAAKSKTIESISYPQYLLIFPMFLFCGVYYPLSALPEAIAWVTYLLPLTPVLGIARSALLGQALEPWMIPAALAWLAVLVPLARRAMTRRLVE